MPRWVSHFPVFCSVIRAPKLLSLPTKATAFRIKPWWHPDNLPRFLGALVVIPIHLASHFPFVTINKDDGTDKGGGWQEATAKLPFGRIYPWGYSLWYCDINIGMPIRHSVKGYVSPATAASESAKVTNSVTRSMDFDLPQGIFCGRFRPAVEEAFKTMYPVGAKAKRP